MAPNSEHRKTAIKDKIKHTDRVKTNTTYSLRKLNLLNSQLYNNLYGSFIKLLLYTLKYSTQSFRKSSKMQSYLVYLIIKEATYNTRHLEPNFWFLPLPSTANHQQNEVLLQGVLSKLEHSLAERIVYKVIRYENYNQLKQKWTEPMDSVAITHTIN